ncbi:MAG TPA: carbamoyltransferase N-terminal domain-containing protein [Streptosporangiaceae bacterium]
MLICGVNITHDAGVAVVDGSRLVFSTEVEKLCDNRRYSQLGDLERILDILRGEGIDPTDVDCFAVNGWYAGGARPAAMVTASQHGSPLSIPVAPYVVSGAGRGQLHRHLFAGIDGGPLRGGYVSYAHASAHVLASYSTSPFAARGEPSLVVAWDGLMSPCLYTVSGGGFSIKLAGPLFPVLGDVFVEFCKNLDPFRHDTTRMNEQEAEQQHLEVPGKAMAFAALGTAEPNVFPVIGRVLRELTQASFDSTVGKGLAERVNELSPGMSDADLIATFQAYLGNELLDGLAATLRRRPEWGRPNLCLTGGCALNIKWNSLLRDSGLFASIWVPPFPNDCGSAIGAACCEMASQTGKAALAWDVYSGPTLDGAGLPGTWLARPCDERALGVLLHEVGEPVAVLHGRAELGPRALGNRSILAPATDPAMKDRLNQIKRRASYRPVAPVCLESRASEIFDPGGPDPYMLFEHRPRTGWAERIPAVVHLDGSARLQTVDPAKAGTKVGRILHEYARVSGIPVLCNTSANSPGRGFFSSTAAAESWGRVPFIWSDGMLYSNPGQTRPERT